MSRLPWILGAIGMLTLAVPTRAQGPATTPPPPTRTMPPSPLPRLAPAIGERLGKTTTAWIYEVDSLPSRECTPRAYTLEDTILCHAVRSSTAAPGKLWISDITSSLGRSSVLQNERPFHADVGVRFLEGNIVTDVLVSVKDRRVFLATMEPTIVEIVPDDPFSLILRILRRALPKNQVIQDALSEPNPSTPVASSMQGHGGPLWPDCAPGPEEGQFVYYEQEPVPVQTPQPQPPPGAKPNDVIRVTLHVFVDRSGRVCFARVVQGSEPFASSAIEAARRWVFTPATSNGKPVGVWVELPFTFKP